MAAQSAERQHDIETSPLDHPLLRQAADDLRHMRIEMMRVLVTGGRNYDDKIAVYAALDDLLLQQPVGAMQIIQGGASGADALARKWCEEREVEYINVPADWKNLGKRAGPIRNQKMIDDHCPDLCMAFTGGRGTDDMISRAIKAGIPVHRVL